MFKKRKASAQSPAGTDATTIEDGDSHGGYKHALGDELSKPPAIANTDAPALSKPRLVLLILALCLAVFCQALDNTIIATAIPRITDEFNSVDDIGWYGSSYLLTTCAFQLTYGKLFNLFPTKWVFLTALAIFEIGSLVCGATPNSTGLILGRAVAGIGSGGIFSGSILTIAAVMPLEKRSIFNGLLASMYAIASVAGPLMGGAFTDKVTWRLCFYINLPFGLITAVCVLFFLSSQQGKNPSESLPLKEKLKSIDILGLSMFLPLVVCLLLALQWGGSTYAWDNARIIVLFVLAGLLLIAFVALQIWQGDGATVPPSVVNRRTVWAASLYVAFLFGSFLVFVYYFPVWLQAIKGVSPIQSGIDNLPSILATVIFSLVGGGLVAFLGYYTWACIISSILAAIGVGLMTTFTPSTSSSLWIGYQIIFGIGIGIGFQQPLIAVQTVLPDNQVAEGTAIILFMQTFGGTVFISVAQTVFNNQLVQNVLSRRIPISPARILQVGATQLTAQVPSRYLGAVREAYNAAITQTLYVCVATAAISLIGAVLMPWYSVKKQKKADISSGEDEKGDHPTEEAHEKRDHSMISAAESNGHKDVA